MFLRRYAPPQAILWLPFGAKAIFGLSLFPTPAPSYVCFPTTPSPQFRLASGAISAIVTGFRLGQTSKWAGARRRASVAQLAEQLICNQQVVGSSPSAGCDVKEEQTGEIKKLVSGGFPSGQRGQTVNLVAQPSQVRILHPPFRPSSSWLRIGSLL